MKDLKAIYFTSRGLPPERRPAFLDQACEDDPALRARVEQMLAVADEAEAFITDLPDDVLESRKFGCEPGETAKVKLEDLPDETVGQRIGRYKILERVGEGGCGVVYVAEQTEPVRRRVALKVIKLGMDTRQVVARFEAERQALAMMDHPNIAKVLDGGATDNGRPYFIMELVRGTRITDYCDQASLPTKDRLGLFIQVCHAIQHAHQKGIIHRDIKPSNILVTLNDGVPVPKVIDFGIAKATEGKLTEATVYTQLHQFIGTPAYMSPEQAEMSSLDIDTRSDIYSLGVLLYELLAGRTPFDGQDLMSLGIDAMRKTIREKQPVRPSTRLATMRGDELTTAAKRRAVEGPRLIHQLKGDLDWIVMRCLEKDRARRYQTANSIASDLKRHLNNEPVLARPPSKLYEFHKTVRRHKFGFAAAALVVATLAAGVVASTWQAVRATRAEQLAQRSLTDMRAAEKKATEQRIRADDQAEYAQRNLYFAQMHVGQQAWREHRGLKGMREILAQWIPGRGAPDRRGWEWFYLNSLPYQNLRTLTPGEGNFVESKSKDNFSMVAWNVAGKELAEGTREGLIRVWDVERERVTLELKAPPPMNSWPGVAWLAWRPDGHQLAAACSDGSVSIWNTPSGNKVRILQAPESSLVSVAFSSEGSRLAAWGSDGSVRIWDVNTGGLIAALSRAPRTICGAWSPDDKLLASGHRDGKLIISGIEAGSKVITLPAHSRAIYRLAWSSDGNRLASAGSDHTVKIWNVASESLVLDVIRHTHEITALAWEPNGARLATGSLDEAIKIWDVRTGGELVTLRGHVQAVGSLAWGPGGSLGSAARDGSLKIWSSLREQESNVLPGHAGRATGVAWSPNGNQLASAGDDGMVKIWDVANRKVVRAVQAHDPIQASKAHTPFPLGHSLVWSPDGACLASAGLDRTTRIWNLARDDEPLTLPLDHEPICSLAWSPDGSRLACASTAGPIRIAEGIGKTLPLHCFNIHDSNTNELNPTSVSWSPRGDRLAFGKRPHLLIWDMAKGAPLVRIENPGFAIFQILAWSPDGTRLASAGFESGRQSVFVWDADTGRKLATMRGHNDVLTALAWSPDGKRLASASLDNSLRIWDPRVGEEAFVLWSHGGMFYDVSWHPGGTQLAAACSDGQIWIWDASRGFERDTTL